MTYGCMYSIACADELACMAIGKKVEEATKLNSSAIVSSLGGVPVDKVHCAEMAAAALAVALKNANVEAEAKVSKGLKEVNAGESRKTIFNISEESQVRHRIAEMFDEYFIPFAKKNGSGILLLDISYPDNIVEVKGTTTDKVRNQIAKALKMHIGGSWKLEVKE